MQRLRNATYDKKLKMCRNPQLCKTEDSDWKLLLLGEEAARTQCQAGRNVV